MSPLFVTVGGLPYKTSLTVPTAIVAAGPAGISKSKIASVEVPLFATVAGFP